MLNVRIAGHGPCRSLLSASATLVGAMLLAPACFGQNSGNGYLGVTLGAARADFSGVSPARDSRRADFRLFAASNVGPHLSLELGVGMTRGFAPPASVSASNPSARIKVTTLDFSPVLRVPVGQRVSLLANAGPVLSSTRAQISVGRGRPTTVSSRRDLTLRYGIGIELTPRERYTIRLALDRLGPVGTDSASRPTGRSAVDTASIGILILF